MHPRFLHAPIDEVVVGFAFDRAVGPDAVESGVYLAERRDRFVRHEIHEPVFDQAGEITLPLVSPIRTWLVSQDERWLVQLQHDRFHANWRRRPDASHASAVEDPYPGFTRDGGVMSFALTEFELLRDFCRRQKGEAPSPRRIEVTKIDLLIQGRHWESVEDAYAMLPAMASAKSAMATPSPEIALQTQENIDGTKLITSIAPARLKADPQKLVFRVEFRAVHSASGQLSEQLSRMNDILNSAFGRLIPDADRRFK